MDYKNIELVKNIINNISEEENKIEIAESIKSGATFGECIELCMFQNGGTIKIALTYSQIVAITNSIIKECNNKLDHYKTQLKDL